MESYIVLALTLQGYVVATSTTFATKDAAVEWVKRASGSGSPDFPWGAGLSHHWAVAKIVTEGVV